MLSTVNQMSTENQIPPPRPPSVPPPRPPSGQSPILQVEYEDVNGKRERINFYEVNDVIYVFSAKDPGDCLLQKQQHYNDNKYTDRCKTNNSKFEKFILGKCVDEQILLKIYDLFLKNASIFTKDVVHKIVNELLEKFKSDEILLAALNHFIDSYKTKGESASVNLPVPDQLMIRLNSNDDIKTVIEDYNKIYPDNPYNYNPASNTTDDVLKKELKDIVRPLVSNKTLAFGEKKVTFRQTPIADIIIGNASFFVKQKQKNQQEQVSLENTPTATHVDLFASELANNSKLTLKHRKTTEQWKEFILECLSDADMYSYIGKINKLHESDEMKDVLVQVWDKVFPKLVLENLMKEFVGGRTKRLRQTLRNKKQRHLKSRKFMKKRKNTMKKHVRF